VDLAVITLLRPDQLQTRMSACIDDVANWTSSNQL